MSQTVAFFELKVGYNIVKPSKARQQVDEVFTSVEAGTEGRYSELPT
jgi:hypothetical protein